MATASVSHATASSQSNNDSSTSKKSILFKFKITLYDQHSPRDGRWRRVVVPANFSLLELHVVIQLVFGWQNCHLHHFMSDNPTVEYTIVHEHDDFNQFHECKDERIYKLSDVFSAENQKLEYEYDFGASWEHEVTFEGVVEANAELDYPACVEGKWANRVEDGNDEDGYGKLLPCYEGKKFSLPKAQREVRKVFAKKWPLKVDNTTLKKCYLCAFHLCSSCNGRCCKYCLKSVISRGSARVSNDHQGSSDED